MSKSTRRAKEDRRFRARLRDLMQKADTEALPPRPTTWAGRPTIAEAELAASPGPRLVLVRCKACGDRLRGVRRMSDGRLVLGIPWVQLNRDGGSIFAVDCSGCGTQRSVRERQLIERAAVAEDDGTQTIRV